MNQIFLNGDEIPAAIFFHRIVDYLNHDSSPEFKVHIRLMLEAIEIMEGFGRCRSLRLVMDRPDCLPPAQKSLLIEKTEFLSNEVPTLIWYLITNANIESVFDPRYSFLAKVRSIVIDIEL